MITAHQEPHDGGDGLPALQCTNHGTPRLESFRLAANTLDIAVRCSHITVALGTAVVICDFTGSWAGGTYVRVLGRNGSGKSTLLGALTGHIRPQAGTVECSQAGRPIVPAEIVFYLPQYPLVFRSLSVRENVLLMSGLKPAQLDDAIRSMDRDNVLSGVRDLLGSLDQRAGDLSTGQQRAAQVLALSTSAKPVLVLDEPEAGLANDLRHEVIHYCERRARLGALAIVAEPNASIARDEEVDEEVQQNV